MLVLFMFSIALFIIWLLSVVFTLFLLVVAIHINWFQWGDLTHSLIISVLLGTTLGTNLFERRLPEVLKTITSLFTEAMSHTHAGRFVHRFCSPFRTSLLVLLFSRTNNSCSTFRVRAARRAEKPVNPAAGAIGSKSAPSTNVRAPSCAYTRSGAPACAMAYDPREVPSMRASCHRSLA